MVLNCCRKSFGVLSLSISWFFQIFNSSRTPLLLTNMSVIHNFTLFYFYLPSIEACSAWFSCLCACHCHQIADCWAPLPVLFSLHSLICSWNDVEPVCSNWERLQSVIGDRRRRTEHRVCQNSNVNKQSFGATNAKCTKVYLFPLSLFWFLIFSYRISVQRNNFVFLLNISCC